MTDIPADEIEVKKPNYDNIDLDAVQSYLNSVKEERQQKGKSDMSTSTIPQSDDIFAMASDAGSSTRSPVIFSSKIPANGTARKPTPRNIFAPATRLIFGATRHRHKARKRRLSQVRT